MPTRTALALAALPVAVVVALLLGGERSWLPLAAAAATALAFAACLRFAWASDQASAAAAEATRQHAAAIERDAGLHALVKAEQGLVRNLPDPLIVLGPTRAIQRMNHAAEAAFGPSIAAVLRHPGLRTAIDRAQAEGRQQFAELTLPVPVSRDVFATVIPLDPPLADGGRIVAVLSDRTRERAVERMRADFVANASHELRTPLASLLGFIATLQGPAADDPPAQARFLAIMAEQAERMNRLIDDLLSLSRIELTEHQPPSDPVDVAALLHRIAGAFEPRIAARAVTLVLDLAPGLPTVAGDEDQLEQVVQNLMDNALKYGREGGTVRLSATPASGPPWPVRPGIAVTVSDDGAGIPRKHIPRLTERFYRADKHRSRAVGGTGLGLAIVKHIVNRHRGRLQIDSTEGVGTTVSTWLPAPMPAKLPVAGSGAEDKA